MKKLNIEIPERIKKLMKKYKQDWFDGSQTSIYEEFLSENDNFERFSNVHIRGTLDIIEALQDDYCSDGCKPYKELELIKKWLYYIYSKDEFEK